jgi:DNA-binding response OmpR family regulator
MRSGKSDRRLLCRKRDERFMRRKSGGAMNAGLHKRILVVEDDPLVSEVVLDALADVYEVSRAETAAAAMDYLRGGGIDAILLDCTLPGGLDPHLVPMADAAGVPVILMSGDPEMMGRVPGVQRRCIQKPFSLTALLTTINNAIANDGVRPLSDGAS